VDPLLYLALLGLALVAGISILMFTLGGLTPGELRERLVSSAVDSYTYQGWSIPGRRRGPFATALLWLLRYDGADAPQLRARRS